MLDTRITAAVASLRFTSLNATVAETYPPPLRTNLDKSDFSGKNDTFNRRARGEHPLRTQRNSTVSASGVGNGCFEQRAGRSARQVREFQAKISGIGGISQTYIQADDAFPY